MCMVTSVGPSSSVWEASVGANSCLWIGPN